jgi:hypothetical protein
LPYPDDDGASISGVALTPCEELKKLVNPLKGPGNIKNNVQRLRTKVATPATNTKEIGFVAKKNVQPDGNVNYFNYDISSNNGNSIEMPADSDIIGGGHTHTGDAYEMYSFGDLMSLKKMYENTSNANKSEIFFIMVGSTETAPVTVKTYVLRVEDINALSQAISSVWLGEYGEIVDLKERIKQIQKDMAKIFSSEPNQDLEKSFLKQFADFGLALYQSESPTLTDWKKLTLDPNPNNPVVKTPCN